MKFHGKQLTALCLGTILLASTTACGYQEKAIAAAELSKNYSRTATEAGLITDDFLSNMSNFSLSLFRETLTKNDKNELVSPISAALCLALINNGANGNTRTQIETLFGMETDALNRALYAYTSSLHSSTDCKVNIENSIWLKENALNVKPSFLQTNADWFDAQIYAAPFDQTTVTDINNWCSNATEGKIDKMLNEIPPLTLMYLINAVDFDAKWEKTYESSDVFKHDFHSYDGAEKSLDFLRSKENIFLSDEHAVGFTRPYKGNEYSFMALLPNEGVDIYDYAASLTGESWLTLWENSDTRLVNAAIPEFTYEAELSLNETLQALGAADMFNPILADFSNIDETQAIYCDTVKQKTFIELDRIGTKAAAITIGEPKYSSMAPVDEIYITLDRPFIYAIVDNENHLPLFLGMVTNL